MSLKSFLGKIYAKSVAKKVKRESLQAIDLQKNVFHALITKAKNTQFGKDHHFEKINDYDDFKKYVPVRDYEKLKPYMEKVVEGKENILWPGKPLYLCKTSGTTSGTKYIPLTKESMPNHINSAKNALLCYIAETGKADFVDGKMIFLQGSPELGILKTSSGQETGIPIGRLSGIVAHHVPKYLQKNRMPSYPTNCIEDWETKVNAIAKETAVEDMRLISGIPSWVQMYFEILSANHHGKNISEIFPNFSLFVYGGVNFEPYRNRFEKIIGKKIDSIELYPASEGFIAYQDSQNENGLLLTINSGIFYEFIPTDEYYNESPTRLSLSEIELDKNYALIINNNAGLWGYSIGDTVKFVSKNPYRIIVSGRIAHYTSAFGEHIIAEEVDYAIQQTILKCGGDIIEFHLAPQVNPDDGELPYHEWFIEFDKLPEGMNEFRNTLEEIMMSKNIYYNDLIVGNVLQPLKIRKVKKGGFNEYMKSQGKLGGQNKIPRLSNDRKIAEGLRRFLLN